MKYQISNIKYQNENKRGLTLIEVLIAMGIAVVAGVLLLVIIVNSAGLFTQQASKVQEGLNTNDALAQVRNAVKQASSVASSYTGGGTTYTSSDSQLVLKVISVDPANNIILDTYDYFVFFKDQNILYFKSFPDPASSRKAVDRILANITDNLKFQYFNSANPPVEVAPTTAKKVRITVTLKQKLGTVFETNTATSEANLRNN